MEIGKVIGKGRTGDVYEYGSNAVVKLFKPQFPDSEVEKEYKMHMVAQKCGLPIPKLYDVITVGDKKGLVYQKINGFSMLDDILQNPSKMPNYAKDTASLHLEISKCTVSNDELVSVNERYATWIGWVDLLSEEEKKKVITYLDKLPTGNTLCHCDFHADNILIADGKYYIIDWITANRGCFEVDVMRSSTIIEYGTKADDLGFSQKIQKGLDAYNKIYLDSIVKYGKYDLGDILKWEIPVLAARLSEGVADNEKQLVLRRLREIL